MKHKVDYKGKYFIIMDDELIDVGLDYIIENMKDEHITDGFLKLHVEACEHFGIPPYIGKDKALIKRIEKLSPVQL